MIKEIRLPEVSENVASGTVVKVLIKQGDKIEKNQAVIELETDKAVFEVPSPESGIVTEIMVKDGAAIKVGEVILKLESNGAASAPLTAKDEKEKVISKAESKVEQPKVVSKIESKVEQPKAVSNTETKVEMAEKPSDILPKQTDAVSDDINKLTVPASPSVRRFAREIGVNINEVKGTGDDGRVSIDDVKEFTKKVMSRKDSSEGIKTNYFELPDFSRWGEVTKEKMSGVRNITSDSLSYAWTTIPQVTQYDKADITSLEEFRKNYIKKNPDIGKNLTITSILVKLSSIALKKFSNFNSSIDINAREIIYKKYYNVGVAVDTDRGLLVPVIKDADKKNILEISDELSQLAEKARTRKITPENMEGGNFTISNLGGIGGIGFSPIVYSPQVAIMGASRSSLEAVYVTDKFEPRLLLPLSLSYDHRVIDGADAARFLRWICSALENPVLSLME